MKVMGFIIVNSPCWFLDDVETSFVHRSPESSHVFTCIGYFYPDFSGRCSGKDSIHRWRWRSSISILSMWILDVEGASLEMTHPQSSHVFTCLGFFSTTCSGRCSGKRFVSSMKVKVWVRVYSCPYCFYREVLPSFEMTHPLSSLAFTCLGFLIWNNEKYKCKYKFYKDLEFWV